MRRGRPSPALAAAGLVSVQRAHNPKFYAAVVAELERDGVQRKWLNRARSVTVPEAVVMAARARLAAAGDEQSGAGQ